MEDHHLPAEDTLVIPEEWHPLLHPRRGGAAVPEITPSASAARRAAARVRKAWPAIEKALDAPKSDPELAERARAHRAGEADPVGAAVIAGVLAGIEQWTDPRIACSFVDAWVAEHGIGFAACAFVEVDDLLVMMSGYSRSAKVVYVRCGNEGHQAPWWAVEEEAGRRLRTFLALADEEDHAEAQTRLAGRRGNLRRRLSTIYLMPHRADWVEECCAAPPAEHQVWSKLLCSIGAEHAGLIADRLPAHWANYAGDVVVTLVEGAGTAAMRLLHKAEPRAGERGPLLDAFSVLPSDSAFEVLREADAGGDREARQPLLAAMERFPVRAIRSMAATAEESATTAGLLTAHLRRHRERVAEMDARTRAVAEKLIEADGRAPEAPADALPSFLVDPPWLSPRLTREPVVITLTPPADATLQWAPGERELWAETAGLVPETTNRDWESELSALEPGSERWTDAHQVALMAPEGLVRPLLAGWDALFSHMADRWMRPIVARFGRDAMPPVLRVFKDRPAENLGLLLPFLEARVARQMAERARRRKAGESGTGGASRKSGKSGKVGKSGREIALAWFERHGQGAVPMLVPAALGKPGPGRLDAEYALRLLASAHGDAAVVRAARVHGDEAADAVADLLAMDPLAVLADGRERPGRWASAHLFPQVLMADGTSALPLEATGHLITLLAMSRPGDVHVGVAPILQVCDPASLADFGWALFEAWRGVGAPSAHDWALAQLGWLGDDTTVRRLTPVIRAWPGENGHHRAVAGLEVLAEIGTDGALLHLHQIAQKVKFKGLQARARAKIQEVAEGLGLTAERLADRLVPDLGLDASGGMTLDYGPRRFVVGFDEQLRPYVTDEDGKRRKALPKPGAKDDPELAPTAYKAFAELKKAVRAIAADQIERLQTAMLTGRRWTAGEFGDLFFRHPLMWHIARRLVWSTVEDAAGSAGHDGTTTSFRIAEDRTFAGIDDEAYVLPEGAEIGLVHPALLPERDRAAWAEVFADYEILQPFRQLGRGVHALTVQERETARLERFEGGTVPVHALLSLVRRGWERGVPMDAGVEPWISKPVPGGLRVVIGLSPGIVVGRVQDSGDQTLEHVWIDDRPDDLPPHGEPRHVFGALDAVTASEVLADLTELTGKNEGA